jgi:hypothetical protein
MDIVVHTCNLSYMAGIGRRITVGGWAQAKMQEPT